MNIDKLEVGKTFKNYKVFCKELGLDEKSSGNSKRHQFKEISRYCNFEKNGQQIIINEIYETPKPKIDGRGKNPNSRNRVKPIYLNNPKLAAQWLVAENGMELPKTLTRTSNEEYWWKCPDCNHKIFSSPAKRFNKCKASKDEFITCPYCYLSKGAKVIYDYLELYSINFKLEYMYDDLLGLGGKKLRFDFALFNYEDELITLIEFDGGYHDKELNPDVEKHKIVSTHDALKNQYCKDNDIPLLRIHHSESDNIVTILSNYIVNTKIPQEMKDKLVKDHEENIINSILNYEEKKKRLQIELMKIDDCINNLKLMIV